MWVKGMPATPAKRTISRWFDDPEPDEAMSSPPGLARAVRRIADPGGTGGEAEFREQRQHAVRIEVAEHRRLQARDGADLRQQGAAEAALGARQREAEMAVAEVAEKDLVVHASTSCRATARGLRRSSSSSRAEWSGSPRLSISPR